MVLSHWVRVSQLNGNPVTTSLVSPIVPGNSLFLPSEAGLTDGFPCLPGIYVISGDLNSGPHACVTNALTLCSTQAWGEPWGWHKV